MKAIISPLVVAYAYRAIWKYFNIQQTDPASTCPGKHRIL